MSEPLRYLFFHGVIILLIAERHTTKAIIQQLVGWRSLSDQIVAFTTPSLGERVLTS